MKEPEYYDADRWGIFSDNYEEKKRKRKSNVQLNYFGGEDILKIYSQDVPFLWGNILPKAGLVCFAGESDCGKSAFLRQLAITFCTSLKGTFLGLKLANNMCQKRALYISTEDDLRPFAATLTKQCRGLNIEHWKLSELKVIFECDDIIEKIELFLKKRHTSLVIIDCLNDILPTQATSAVAIRKFLSKLQFIAENNQCLIILTHHTNKYARNRKPSKYNLIGSPALEAKCRTVIEMRTDPFQRNIKHLCVVKGNYTPDGEKDKSYMLEFTPNLTFKNTFRRVDIDTLTLMPDHIADRVERYNSLRSEGLKGDELAKAMGFASRGSLSVWVKKYIKTNNDSPKPIEPTNPIEPTEPTNPTNPTELSAPSEPQPSPQPQPSPEPQSKPQPQPSRYSHPSPSSSPTSDPSFPTSPSNNSTAPPKPPIPPF